MCLGRPVHVAWHGVQAGLSVPLAFSALGRVPSCSEKNAPPRWAEAVPLDRSTSSRSPLDLVSQAPLEGAFIFLASLILEVKSHQLEAAFWLLLESRSGSEEVQASSPPLRPPRCPQGGPDLHGPRGLHQPLRPEWAGTNRGFSRVGSGYQAGLDANVSLAWDYGGAGKASQLSK